MRQAPRTLIRPQATTLTQPRGQPGPALTRPKQAARLKQREGQTVTVLAGHERRTTDRLCHACVLVIPLENGSLLATHPISQNLPKEDNRIRACTMDRDEGALSPRRERPIRLTAPSAG